MNKLQLQFHLLLQNENKHITVADLRGGGGCLSVHVYMQIPTDLEPTRLEEFVDSPLDQRNATWVGS